MQRSYKEIFCQQGKRIPRVRSDLRVKVLRGYDLLQAEASSQMDDGSDRVGGRRCKSRSRYILQTYRGEGGK